MSTTDEPKRVLFIEGGTIPWNGNEATGTTEALVMWNGGDEWIDVELTARRVS